MGVFAVLIIESKRQNFQIVVTHEAYLNSLKFSIRSVSSLNEGRKYEMSNLLSICKQQGNGPQIQFQKYLQILGCLIIHNMQQYKYILMFQNLLKGITSTRVDTDPPNNKIRGSPYMPQSNGWEDSLESNTKEQTAKFQSGWAHRDEGTPTFMEKMGAKGGKLEYLQSQMAIQMDISVQCSEKVSQVLSINDFGEQSNHPMILSDIPNNIQIQFNRLPLLRIRKASSALRQAHYDLRIYAQQQRLLCELLRQSLTQEFYSFISQFTTSLARQNRSRAETKQFQANRQQLQRQLRMKTLQCQRLNRDYLQYKDQFQKEQQREKVKLSKRLEQQKLPCSQCSFLEVEKENLNRQLRQMEKQVEKLLIENEGLQEYVFDMEQKVVGVDIEIEKRLKEKNRFELPPISPIREDKQLVEQLESQVSSLQQKCRKLEDQVGRDNDLKQMQSRLREKEAVLLKKDSFIKQQMSRLESLKVENSQREQEILAAEQNLSNKIADFRKRQAELTQKSIIGTRGNSDYNLANKFPSNDASFQHSREDLNQSCEISLKSFGKSQRIEDKLEGSPSREQIEDHQPSYKIYTLNNEETENNSRKPHQLIRERSNHQISHRSPIRIETDGKRFRESAYLPKRKQQISNMIVKRYNAQLGSYKDSREASPFRNINQSKARANPYDHQYALPKPSPKHYRETSKNSRSSISKSKASVRGVQVPQSGGRAAQRTNQLGGLGSKLERLRQEIKKEIDSIK